MNLVQGAGASEVPLPLDLLRCQVLVSYSSFVEATEKLGRVLNEPLVARVAGAAGATLAGAVVGSGAEGSTTPRAFALGLFRGVAVPRGGRATDPTHRADCRAPPRR